MDLSVSDPPPPDTNDISVSDPPPPDTNDAFVVLWELASVCKRSRVPRDHCDGDVSRDQDGNTVSHAQGLKLTPSVIDLDSLLLV